MDREWGAPDALAFVRRTDFAPSAVAFDAAFAGGGAESSGGFGVRPRRRGGGRPPRSASACSATRSWARRTRTRTRRSPYMTWPPPLRAAARRDRRPQRGGRGRGRAPLRLRAHVTDWRELRRRPRGPAVRQLGPEQPPRRADDRRGRGGQARDLREAARPHADECYETWQRVEAAGVKHMCAFNYRFVPAVRLAREMHRGRRARRDPPLPRPLPAGVGDDRPRRPGGSTRTTRARARSATSART